MLLAISAGHSQLPGARPCQPRSHRRHLLAVHASGTLLLAAHAEGPGSSLHVGSRRWTGHHALVQGGLAAVVACYATQATRRRIQKRRYGQLLVLEAARSAKVLVAGGGLAGLNLALRLAEMPWRGGCAPRVTLVDPKERFVFLPLLVDYATSIIELDDFAPRFTDLLKDSAMIEHVQGRVSSVNWRRRTAHLVGSDAASTESFDAMVLASGSLAGDSVPPELPGLKEAVAAGRAQGFSTLEDAQALLLRLTESGTSSFGPVAVIGAGYVGVEVAAGLAEAGLQVALFGSELLSQAEPANRDRASERLEKLGVSLRRGRVVAIGDGTISWASSSGAEVQKEGCSFVLVTGALAAAPLDGRMRLEPQLKEATSGRATVDSFLRVAPGVFCLGDVAAGSAPTGQTAMQQADVAAWNLFAQLSGLPRVAWRSFQTSALGEFVALGRSNAAGVVQPDQLGKLLPPALPPALARAVAPAVASLGSGGGSVDVGGPVAALLRRLAYLYRMPTVAHRLRVAKRWLESAEEVFPGLKG
eukprot:TRINITY_DN20181_c0_g1_i1.p1 TRINITY_DN20181_c0_g1~~TRINITY_DN20181_c0_g1_i1.p1  ORF type:complete len:530 (+),score=105.32 TRINITY_DN20181_c0_g1_i1:31-1620(+)